MVEMAMKGKSLSGELQCVQIWKWDGGPESGPAGEHAGSLSRHCERLKRARGTNENFAIINFIYYNSAFHTLTSQHIYY